MPKGYDIDWEDPVQNRREPGMYTGYTGFGTEILQTAGNMMQI